MAVDAAWPRPRRKGRLPAVGVGLLLLAVGVDLALHVINHGLVWPALVVLPVGLAALVGPDRWRPRWLTLPVRTAGPALASLTYTAVAFIAPLSAEFGPGEVVIMLSLLMVAVRTGPPTWAAVCGLAASAAVVALPLRPARFAGPDYSPIFLLAVLVVAVAVLGVHLRSMDTRRHTAVTEARHAERLSIAADLHDHIAHHVTGILVQTQMARMLVADRPGEVDPILHRVEHAATEALAAMRRTVGILRADPTTGAASRLPVGDLATLPQLVTGFHLPTGTRAVLHPDPAIPDNVPHEIQAAAYRVVQESLTNIRRHAADATTVDVDVHHDDHTLRVTIRDDGRGGAHLPLGAYGGGFGLVGLTERVTALGGALVAGPQPGGAWQVTARLPCQSQRL